MNLPLLNASLNGTAGLLLVGGFIAIKLGREKLHIRLMMLALLTSCAFLISYGVHHLTGALTVKYTGPDSWKTAYLVLLLTHTVLAAIVPFLAIRVAFLGIKGRRESHRKLAKITFPIWIYVSITGVLIYLTLYVWTDSWEIARASL